MIAVTGATGHVGRLVAQRLAEGEIVQRLLVRDPARAPRLGPLATTHAIAGYDDADGLRAALDGAETLLLVPAAEHPDRVAQHATAIDAAADAGVERVVYLSFAGAAPDATFTLARDHFHTEEALRVSGMRWCLLRMNLYLDLLPWMVGSDLVLRGPGGDGAFTPVARRDVADTAVAALLDDAHDGDTLDVSGPDRITLAHAATTMARVAGRDIRYERETPEQAYASRAHFGAPAWEVEGWVTSYEAIAAGDLDLPSETVEELVGREPIGLAAWMGAHLDQLAHII